MQLYFSPRKLPEILALPKAQRGWVIRRSWWRALRRDPKAWFIPVAFGLSCATASAMADYLGFTVLQRMALSGGIVGCVAFLIAPFQISVLRRQIPSIVDESG